MRIGIRHAAVDAGHEAKRDGDHVLETRSVGLSRGHVLGHAHVTGNAGTAALNIVSQLFC